MPGFIQDHLDLKFLILYIAARVIEPVPFDTLLDLSLCDDAVDYFDFSECLADLLRTGHLARSNDLYSITEKGLRNSKICESSLPYSLRLRCDKNLTQWNRKLRRKNQVRASTAPRPNGTHTLRLTLNDDAGNLMDLSLMVPRPDMAKAMETRFRSQPEKLYSDIIALLLKEDDAP